ncbi:MAG: hypothetical protein LBK83_07220, partial [Treponema sp.]|nr:hypothetical protein [Treponema sp.]
LSDQKKDGYNYNGAGTSFGDWIAYEQTDARFVSVCYYAYGSVSEWLFRYVGGIEADEENPGFKHFVLQPAPDDRNWFPQNQQRIDWVNTVYHSCRGDIVSSWNRKADGRISSTAVVPANTTATLYLPVAAPDDKIYEGDKLAAKAEGVEYIRTENNKAVFKLQSGTYYFDVRSP